jgi:hypothetical protein
LKKYGKKSSEKKVRGKKYGKKVQKKGKIIRGKKVRETKCTGGKVPIKK